ncbi:MMPL family transporter [Desulforhopalus vacuolatus]|uniref:MMPL family transporter n=1 Tax=Desulforhopalus vacuolatus TaxID=40414 RepID=UPI001965A9EC|nr:MMPL family transporter [Desulforhopalus vacuolatus]MBM9519740.1 MMPL family transporter [Desulforhopalus vacuolatus]
MEKNFILLNSLAGIPLKKQLQKDPLDFRSIVMTKLAFLRDNSNINLQNGFLISADGRNILIFAESRPGLTDSNNARKIQNDLEQIYKQVLPVGITARVIGTLPHTLANSQTIKADLQTLLPIATILLFLLLAFTLKSVRAIVVFAVPLLASLPAIAITVCFFNGMSGLALGFGIVLLGIAVDFSVHLFVALTNNHGEPRKILQQMRRPLLFATATTTCVFLVLFFSDVPAHRQMACLALSGILNGVLFAWLLIPTLHIEPQNNALNSVQKPNAVNKSVPHKVFTLLWAVLLCLGIFAWPHIHYDGNLQSLDAPGEDVAADEAFFNQIWGTPGDKFFIVSVGGNLEEALEQNDILFDFLSADAFKQIQTIAPILPSIQKQKQNGLNWKDFWTAELPQFHTDFPAIATKFGFTPQAFAPFFHWLQRPVETFQRERFDGSPLAPMLKMMIRPDSSMGNNQMIVLTTVSGNSDKIDSLLSFSEKHPAIHVLANQKWKGQVERSLKDNILFLSGLAAFLVSVLVFIQFKHTNAILAVLAPVLAALAGMMVFCWVMGYTLNMMHVIMGIMVIGLTVDYGIFAICSQLEPNLHGTEKAISICATSTLIGFGVLAFSSHPALHSLGITVLVGIGVGWPVSLLVSPYLFTLGKKRSTFLTRPGIENTQKDQGHK